MLSVPKNKEDTCTVKESTFSRIFSSFEIRKIHVFRENSLHCNLVLNTLISRNFQTVQSVEKEKFTLEKFFVKTA